MKNFRPVLEQHVYYSRLIRIMVKQVAVQKARHQQPQHRKILWSLKLAQSQVALFLNGSSQRNKINVDGLKIRFFYLLNLL